MKKEVIAVFDIGKTNKKFLLFDKDFNCLHKICLRLPETFDEDLFPCEDYFLLKDWVLSTFAEFLHNRNYKITSLNFSAYGATLVNIDNLNQPITPIYNYLKPYDKRIIEKLYESNGGIDNFCIETASPSLGHLNSGLTLYWIKETQPDIFNRIKYSLNLPEFLSFLFTENIHSVITSIGCHTHLWSFKKNNFHSWVFDNRINNKIAPLVGSNNAIRKKIDDFQILVGMGMHDSSASIVPHLKFENEKFILLSTGTWSIALNPFNHDPLSKNELMSDCLCYLSHLQKPIKAARYFAGKIHEDMLDGLCKIYNKDHSYFYKLKFDERLFLIASEAMILDEIISYYNLSNAEQAYHQFIYSLVLKIIPSIQLASGSSGARKIIVDGGFSKNLIFIETLKRLLPEYNISKSHYEEASALGSAMIMQNVCKNMFN